MKVNSHLEKNDTELVSHLNDISVEEYSDETDSFIGKSMMTYIILLIITTIAMSI